MFNPFWRHTNSSLTQQFIAAFTDMMKLILNFRFFFFFKFYNDKTFRFLTQNVKNLIAFDKTIKVTEAGFDPPPSRLKTD